MIQISTTMKHTSILFSALLILFLASCKKDNTEPDPTPQPEDPAANMPTACMTPNSQPGAEGPGLVFKFRFNNQQMRLNSFGNEAGIASGNAGQSPSFNTISAHYVELAPSAWTALGTGQVLYTGPETTAGGETALDFDQAIVNTECEDFIRIPFSAFEPGTYEWIRVSLSYQNYNINYRLNGQDLTGTLASFIGFNSYITDYKINSDSDPISVNGNKLQGYWGFETTIPFWGTETTLGQVPAGGITVPNPLFNSAPIPAGSCVVTGDFAEPLVISGTESQDIVVVISLSTNKSFEWVDVIPDGKYEPLNAQLQATGEVPVDMGVRGLMPVVIPQ